MDNKLCVTERETLKRRKKEGGEEGTQYFYKAMLLGIEANLLIYYNREMKSIPCPMERMLSSIVDVSSVTITFTNLIFTVYQMLNYYGSIIYSS